MTTRLNPLTRLDAALAALTFALALTLYVRTLAPGLLLGDSAEFQTLAYTLGMTHPTGYPVYVLLARLFTLLPLGDLAWRVNLFSAVAASLALALLYLAGRVLVGWRIAALAGPLALSVCQVFWWQAIIAELYTAASALLAGAILLLVLWRRTDDWRYLAGAGLLGGLSLGVHNTVALAAPAVLIYLLLTARTRKAWLGAAGGAALGVLLTLTAFAFLDARDAPSGYYNSVARHALSVWSLSASDFDAPWERWGFLYSARQFRPFMFAGPLTQARENFAIYQEHLNTTFAPLAVGLMGLGVLALIARRWREGVLLTLTWLTMLIFVLNYDIWDIQVFYIPTYVLLSLSMSVGAAAILDGVAWALGRITIVKPWAAGGALMTGALILVSVLWPMTPAGREAWQAGRITFLDGTDFAEYPYPVRDPAYPYQAVALFVARLEDDAIVFTNWDMLYAYYFVAHVEQGRTGLAFHETYPQDGVRLITASTMAYIDANLGKRPIYFDDRPDSELRQQYTFKLVDSRLRLYTVVGRKGE
jgi:hypothetical protein